MPYLFFTACPAVKFVKERTEPLNQQISFMNKPILPILFLLLHFAALSSYSQDIPPDEPNQKSLPAGFYAGGQASTNGMGLNLRYIIGKRFSVTAGVETIHLMRDFQVHGYGVPFDAKIDYKSGGVFLMGELFYTRSLYISAGIISNSFQPRAEGKPTSSIRYGDIVLQPSTIGTLSLEVEPQHKQSPYAGLGIRQFIGKNQVVSCNFETGLFYLGAPNMYLKATGLLQPTADPANGKEEYLEAQFSAYKYYPVVKAGIAVRLF